jgi:hypothetical protein
MRRVIPAAIVAVALMAAGFVGLTARHPAKAQTTTEVVFVFSDRFQGDSLGRIVLGGGTNDGILGVQCSGSNPQGGTAQIPAQVMTQLLSTTTNIRIFNNVGKPVSGLVRLNCTVDALTPTIQTPTAKRFLGERTLHQVG